MAFILAWPLLLGLKGTHRPKGQSMVPRWGKKFTWLGNSGPFGGFQYFGVESKGFTARVCEQLSTH